MNNRPLMRCENLSFSYGKEQTDIIHKLSISLQKGEAVVVMGPSGCGKSTLAYCLAGLYPEYAGCLKGEIYYGDEVLNSLTPELRAKRVSILFQNPDNQFCMDSVEHELLFTLENINCPTSEMENRVTELLKMVGLEGLEKTKLHTLSGGTKQKVALAAAMAAKPEMLILDEPFANIDPDACTEISKKILQLHRLAEFGLLIVDHRLDYWKDIADRVIVLSRSGQIAADFPMKELPKHRGCFEELGLFYESDYSKKILTKKNNEHRGETAISAKNLLVKRDKKTVIESLDIEITKGTITSIVGKNGSGKTTLLWALAGLIKCSGKLGFFGKVGLVFQNPGYQFLTQLVEDEVILSLSAANGKVAPYELKQKANELLEEFDLYKYRNASPYTLSQGQQRRLAVLTMLSGEQDILLLDEPTYAQDARATRFIMDKISARVACGLTTVISTHDIELAKAYSDLIVRLDEGRIIYRTQFVNF